LTKLMSKVSLYELYLHKNTKIYLRLNRIKVHNGELAKQYQVSLALTRKGCPAKVDVTYL